MLKIGCLSCVWLTGQSLLQSSVNFTRCVIPLINAVSIQACHKRVIWAPGCCLKQERSDQVLLEDRCPLFLTTIPFLCLKKLVFRVKLKQEQFRDTVESSGCQRVKPTIRFMFSITCWGSYVDVAASSVCYRTSDLSLCNPAMFHVYSTFVLFSEQIHSLFRPQKQVQLLHICSPSLCKMHPKYLVPFDLCLSGGLGLHSNIPRHTRMHAYTHKKNSPFQLK